MSLIYKIATRQEWTAALTEGEFQGSPDDKRDGFIHFSTEDQVATTLSKHFSNKDNLLLLAVEAEDLGDALKWEPSRGGALFPHLYAPLPTARVLWEKPIERTAAGEFQPLFGGDQSQGTA